MTLFSKQGNYLLGAGIELSTRTNTSIPNERRRQRPPVAMQAALKFVKQGHPSA